MYFQTAASLPNLLGPLKQHQERMYAITMPSEIQSLLSARPEYGKNSTMQKPSLGYAVQLLFIVLIFQGAQGL